MDFLNSMFGSSSSLIDGAKLVLIGGTIETARRVGQTAWTSFLSSFYLTAHFSEDDYPYDWLQYWLQRQPQWRSSREFETTTRTTTVGSKDESLYDDYEPNDPNDEEAPGKQKMHVVFQPTFDSTIGIYYRKHWLRVRRWKNNGTEHLSISVIARNNSVLKQLVLEAKKMYESDAEHRVNIYFADSHGSWRWTDSRGKRPLGSIVLEKGVKEMLLADCRDFLKSEKWYATRGIPFRRGYLLYGLPGSGKTSLIHALAGSLGLDIYVVSLSASWINDATLSQLMGRVPARCIVLLEDLDAAFTRSATRDEDSNGAPGGKNGNENAEERHMSAFSRRRDFVPDYNTLSLSGLLNSLDGVSAPEGRLLFATTNHLDRLDTALTRPGRMDIWIEFKYASKWQAELLFKNFFSEMEDAPQPTDEEIATMQREFALLEAREKDKGQVSFVPKEGTSSPTAGAEAMAAATEAQEKLKEKEDEDLLSLPILERPSGPLDPEKLNAYARKFAAAIPENEHSVASLQGYLLRNKSRPEAAVAEASAWVLSERALRARLKREREEREAKMAIEREKRRKEREEAKRRAEREEARRIREEEARIRKEDEEYAAEEKRLAEEEKKKKEEEKKGPEEKAATEKEKEKEKEKEEEKETTSTTEASTPTTTTSSDSEPAPSSGTSEDEIDGETPGAASVVLVKPEASAS